MSSSLLSHLSPQTAFIVLSLLIMPSRRPRVVLAGWLGCQPRNLRRCEALYKTLGLEVVTCIATPLMVVGASRSSPLLSEAAAPHGSIQALAWEVFREVQDNPWFFHSFSNGGCFVWEQLRMIVEREKGTKPTGVVFDSSPANYQGNNNLSKALSYCTWNEQARIRLQILWGGAKMQRQRQERARLYWDGLSGDAWNTRQLYLCSQDDELTPFEDLKELVKHRQRAFGEDRIWLKDWQSSSHCTHLLQHPDDYREIVESFVDSCLYDKNIKSRL